FCLTGRWGRPRHEDAIFLVADVQEHLRGRVRHLVREIEPTTDPEVGHLGESQSGAHRSLDRAWWHDGHRRTSSESQIGPAAPDSTGRTGSESSQFKQRWRAKLKPA